jgi:hypothetical protein
VAAAGAWRAGVTSPSLAAANRRRLAAARGAARAACNVQARLFALRCAASGKRPAHDDGRMLREDNGTVLYGYVSRGSSEPDKRIQ